MAKSFVVAILAFTVVLACRNDHAPATSTMTQTATAKAPATTFHVVTLGDSLAYGTGDESGKGIAGRLDPGAFTVENLGVNGAQTSDLIGKLGQKRFRDKLVDA